MDSRNTSASTWQKIALILSVLVVAVPAFVRFGYQVLFPESKVVYSIAPSLKIGDSNSTTIIVQNQGSASQGPIVVSLSTDDQGDSGLFYGVDRTSYGLGFSSIEPRRKVISQNGEARITLGTIDSGEAVALAIKATEGKNSSALVYYQLDVDVRANDKPAMEARQLLASFDTSLHSAYYELAPILLAFVLCVLGVIMLIGMLHSIFFDSLQAQSERLLKQLSDLQEKIDKERFS